MALNPYLIKDENVFSLDIETVANEAMIPLLPEPEIKIGNTKDASKIEAKRKEAKLKWIENMAKHPETGMVCSYAVYGKSIQECKVIDSISYSEEISLITNILELLNDHSLIITHNGMNFDIPFIFKRAMINYIDMSDYNFSIRKWIQRYSITPHFDTMQVWNNWSHDYKNCSLDYLGCLLLGEGKTDRNYSEYLDLIKSGQQEKIGIDNMCDAKITYRIFEKMRNYFYKDGDL